VLFQSIGRGRCCRANRKAAHFGLQTAAVLCIAAALVAAFQSHNLKLPSPIPNRYSVHSSVGLCVAIATGAQYCAAFYTFWWPQGEQAWRARLQPLHAAAGACIYAAALATILVRSKLERVATLAACFDVWRTHEKQIRSRFSSRMSSVPLVDLSLRVQMGLAEKATFVKLGGADAYSAVMRMPVLAALAVLPLLVLPTWRLSAAAHRMHGAAGDDDEEVEQLLTEA
jgi:Eukaryotic cytochrome b561